MLQYVDSFYCASNPSKKTLVMRLRQEEPIESKETGNVEIRVNEVSDIVLDYECAKKLATSILQLLDSTEPEDSNVENN